MSVADQSVSVPMTVSELERGQNFLAELLEWFDVERPNVAGNTGEEKHISWGQPRPR